MQGIPQAQQMLAMSSFVAAHKGRTSSTTYSNWIEVKLLCKS